MTADKACPVVLRRGQTLEILAFEHPLAGLQLVKGSVEPGEPTDVAAVRELFEEAGITATAKHALGEWRSTLPLTSCKPAKGCSNARISSV